jgi:preprotein translocase subunit SecD
MISTKAKILVSLMIFTAILLGSNCKSLSRLIDKGGKIFIVEIETDQPNRAEIFEQAVKVTQNKIDAIGLDGEVTKNPGQDNQISVKIYGTNDWEVVKKFLFTTYQLELRKAVSPPSPSPIQTFKTREEAEEKVKQDQEVFPYLERDSEIRQFIIVEKQVIINGEDIRDAYANSLTDDADNYQISFALTPEGAKKFGDWTGKNIGNYIAVVLNKEVQSVAFIRSQIFDHGQIDGRFTKQSAEDIALSLGSGYLPATMKIIEEKPF